MRGAQARFADVAGRMEAALRDRGITEPGAWLAGGPRDLDQALAETVTLIVDDVLVDRLLARLHSNPLARRLFVAASVFRTPVSEHGLNWAVAESLGPPPDPARAARIRRTSGSPDDLDSGPREFALSTQVRPDWWGGRREQTS